MRSAPTLPRSARPSAARRAAQRPALVRWAASHPNVLAFLAYLVLSVLFFLPGLMPGHTTSGSDYLWSAAPWSATRPAGIPLRGLHPMVFGSNPVLVDPVTVFQVFLQYTRSQLPHIPLWDPYILGGMPYLADMQSAIFSPFSLPAYILPFWWSLSVIAVLKLLVASMGAYLLGRTLGMRFAGAFLCGSVFGFGLFMVTWVGWPLTNVFPLIPWLLLATDRLVRRPGALPAVALAVLIALQFFGGHPESSFEALFATGAFFVMRVIQGSSGLAASVRRARASGGSSWAASWSAVRRPLVAFVAAAIVGTAMAAIVIIPFLELLHQSSDLTSRPRTAVYIPAKYFFSVFFPNWFPSIFKNLTGFYVGALTLALALVAITRRRAERVTIAIFCTVCILVVLGVQPFFGIVSHLPGFDSTYNTRLTILYLLGMGLLAGWGLDDLTRWRPRGRKALYVNGVALALLVVPTCVALAIGGISSGFFGHAFAIAWGIAPALAGYQSHAVSITRLAAIIVWVVFAGLASLLLYARSRQLLRGGLFAALAIVLVLGDLFLAGMGYNPAIPDSTARQPVTPAIRFLERQGLARFVTVEPTSGVNPIPPDVGIRYSLYDARGYDFPVEARFGAMWTRYVAPPNPLLPLNTTAVPQLNLELDPGALRILSLLGVRDLLEAPGQPPLRLAPLHAVYRGRDATIYANSDALPRTWLVTHQQLVHSGSAALAAIGSASFHPRTTVVTEQALPNLSSTSTGHGNQSTSPGTARITRYTAEGVTIHARSTGHSELVLSDTWFPGWSATVDGRPVAISRVDYVLRGVALGPGSHTIVFSYDPASFREGWLLSLGATLVVAATLVVVLLRRRMRRRGRAQPVDGRARHRSGAGGLPG
jgi:hypothetical protein